MFSLLRSGTVKTRSVSQTIEEVSAIISSTFSSKSELFSRSKGHFKVLGFLDLFDPEKWTQGLEISYKKMDLRGSNS